MKLTRQQELVLINIGLSHVLNGLVKPTTKKVSKKKPKSTKRKWSETQRKKFAKTMAKVWKDKKAAENA